MNAAQSPQGTPAEPADPAAPAIALIDAGAGNVRSVSNALTHLGVRHEVATEPPALERATHIILPGVGAFGALMARLRERDLIEPLTRRVLGDGVPFLGICVGMQILCDVGEEFGETPGLGWIPGRCVHLDAAARAGLPVPHVGWNDVAVRGAEPLWSADPNGGDPDFYFVHSYHVRTLDPLHTTAVTDYGEAVAAVIRRGHVAGVQFHPEKSQGAGLTLLGRFAQTPAGGVG